jgi:tetratricopeptide (TPR) repeat protein
MAIRKEQVLVLLTLAFGAWTLQSLLQDPPRAAAFQPTKIDYAAAAVTPTVLVAGSPPAATRRDFCTEPSETRPLPPRALEFPPRAPLSVAALPLDGGPDFGHLWALRIDGAQVDGVVIQPAAEVPTEAAPTADVAEPNGRRDQEEQAARTYDRIWIVNQKAPYFGTIEADGRDLFELEERRDFEGVELRMRVYSLSRQQVGRLESFGKDERRIERIALAETLRNEVQRRVRRVPPLASHLEDRRELITWLLDKAREAEWVYDVALAQADIYRQVSHGDLEGLRLQQRVLQARGDLAAEFALLDGLAGEQRESAFRYEALGVIKARLGLDAEAERDLRRAVAIAPTDARPHAALAEFLRRQGRSGEAAAAADLAERTIGSLQGALDRVRTVRVIVAARLARADVDAARAALQLLRADEPQPYLVGCVQYTAGDVAGALASFRQASGSIDGAAAQVGQAACLLRAGQWQEAHDLFVRVFDEEPLQRHRAATGLALLFCRLGQFDAANVWIDRALEAAPDDAYAFYLRGRCLRLQGQLAAAVEALQTTLRRHDDFVHAIAEMAAVQAGRAQEGHGSDQAAAALAARRYADRAVALVHTPAVELFELQGLLCYAAADPRGARAAFVAARDLAADDAGKLFGKGSLAVVDYSRGLVDDATSVLQRLVQDLDKDAPMRQWATATLAAIDDHAEKEMLDDGFERAEVGSVWAGDRDGSLWAQVEHDALVFRGKLSRTGSGEVFAERLGAVRNGKNFLAVACTLQCGAGQPAGDGFAGLRIEMQRGGGGHELRVQVGIREGQPFLRIEDGRSDGREEIVQQQLQVADFDRLAAHQLELRVVPRGEAQSRALALQVRWNGLVVHQHDLKMLTGNTSTELKTALFASGSKGSDIDVRFDDYRLERRKGR